MIRVAALILALAACTAKSEPAPTEQRPKPITMPERQRGQDACRSYVQLICACATATKKPDLQHRCDLDRALPEALDMALSVDDATDGVREDIITAQAQARNIVAGCVQKTAALPGDGCR